MTLLDIQKSIEYDLQNHRSEEVAGSDYSIMALIFTILVIIAIPQIIRLIIYLTNRKKHS